MRVRWEVKLASAEADLPDASRSMRSPASTASSDGAASLITPLRAPDPPVHTLPQAPSQHQISHADGSTLAAVSLGLDSRREATSTC